MKKILQNIGLIITIILVIVCIYYLFSKPKNISNQKPYANFKESIIITDSNFNYSKQDNYANITCIGHLKNTAGTAWEDIVFEVQYFNSSNELIDSISAEKYYLVLPPHDTASFKASGNADKKIDQYQSHKVFVKWAEEKQPYAEKSNKYNMLFNIFISWTPIIIFIGVWIIFMKGLKSSHNKRIEYLEKTKQFVDEFVKISNRVAISLEKISENKKEKVK